VDLRSALVYSAKARPHTENMNPKKTKCFGIWASEERKREPQSIDHRRDLDTGRAAAKEWPDDAFSPRLLVSSAISFEKTF